ncbi:MAG: DUF819 family protein [Bacteroidales bacterium]|nr:DUF819 family protein [Bacteroidales bacterium]
MRLVFTLLYLLLVPFLVMKLSVRYRWIERVSPMTVLYGIGLLVANVLPEGYGVDTKVNNLVSNVAVPLAIPLMLMGCRLAGWHVGKAAKVFATGLTAVLVASVSGYFIFRNSYGDSLGFAQVCAVATGIYTGGIPNMGAIKQAVAMPDETYLYITSYDLIVTGLYLVFIIFLGKTVFRKLLPAKKDDNIQNSNGHDIEKAAERINPFDHEHRRTSLLAILLTLLIAAISYAASLIASSDGSPNMTVLILLLTTLAIGASFLPPMRKQEQSFDIGLYFVYVFCLAVATACDVRQMDLVGSLPILYYLGYIIAASLMVQVVLSRIMKIDGDTVMVSSVALINSPPFVPMAAALLGNKEVVITGITIGLLGYMVGNYIGILIFNLLATVA